MNLLELIFFIVVVMLIISFQIISTCNKSKNNTNKIIDLKDKKYYTSNESDDINKSIYTKSVNCESHDRIIDKFVSTYHLTINTPYVIGICGASGSGKTFISKLISKTIKKMSGNNKCKYDDIVTICQDSYYLGGDENTNYDIPKSIDLELMITHLKQLISGEEINCPCYDFTTHSRLDKTEKKRPSQIIIVEGILIFNNETLRNLFNMKIYIDAEIPTQIFRRISRDVDERQRTIKEVRQRFRNHVWPSYIKFVQPSSRHADMIINNNDDCFVGPQIMLNHIITILDKKCQND